MTRIYWLNVTKTGYCTFSPRGCSLYRLRSLKILTAGSRVATMVNAYQIDQINGKASFLAKLIPRPDMFVRLIAVFLSDGFLLYIYTSICWWRSEEAMTAGTQIVITDSHKDTISCLWWNWAGEVANTTLSPSGFVDTSTQSATCFLYKTFYRIYKKKLTRTVDSWKIDDPLSITHCDNKGQLKNK